MTAQLGNIKGLHRHNKIIMKRLINLGIFALIIVFSNCAKEELSNIRTEEEGVVIGFINHTGHAPFCDKGETLIFSLSNSNCTKEIEIGADSGGDITLPIKQGENITIKIQSTGGLYIFQKTKPFDPENPEVELFGGLPTVTVCRKNNVLVQNF